MPMLRQAASRRLLATIGLFLLIVCAMGILRPIKNALALEGLGATGFYKVYIVSAAVTLFVPLYNRLADRIAWRHLIPAVMLFFVLNLLAFRVAFDRESAVVGLLFYGWFDLLTAVLVTQFFLVAQLHMAGQNAKEVYPLLIAGGAVGATIGSAVTALAAQAVGTANLLLVAAALIALAGAGLPWLLSDVGTGSGTPQGVRPRGGAPVAELRDLVRNPHARLIALSVFLAVLVKQLLDYQFNTISLEVFRTRDAVSAFQGAVNAATQWLPLAAALVLRPLIRRWGIRAAVLLLPGAMVAATLGVALFWGLWTVVVARTAENSLRYSAERVGREVLYIPLPDEIKLKAKTYIDVAIENGVAKIAAAGLIFVLLRVLDPAGLAYVAAALALAWLGVAIAIRGEYVQALARSVAGRYASLRGLSASVADASTRPVLQAALAGGELQAAFALDLLDRADRGDVLPFAADLHRLLDAPGEEIRLRALLVLAKVPEAVELERVRARLADPAARVRQTAVRVLCLARPAERTAILGELLASPESTTRTAALSCLALGEMSLDGARFEPYPSLEEGRSAAAAGDGEARLELALAAGALRPSPREAEALLLPLLGDPDPAVVCAALHSAGLLGLPGTYPGMLRALRSRATRSAAREALVRQGTRALPLLAEQLLDPSADPAVRRHLPSVLAGIRDAQTPHLLLCAYAAPETDQALDYRTLKALSRLRASHPALPFDAGLIDAALEREVSLAVRYGSVLAVLQRRSDRGPAARLLGRALREGWRERRESAFRLLGLLHPPREVHRCYAAIVAGDPARRANAREWLEETLGHRRFPRIEPVLGPVGGGRPGALDDLWRLWEDGDAWIARCAVWAAVELRLPGAEARLREMRRAPPHPDFGELAQRLLREPSPASPPPPRPGEYPMDLIEKVFLLQQVDLLEGARSSDLALLASIVEEVDADPGAVLVRPGEPAEALYVVIRGAVEIAGQGVPPMLATEGMWFGSWALVEEAESLVAARVERPSHLLRLAREHFHDLLEDHPELGIGLMQGLAHRLRSLVSWRLEKIHEDHRVDESEREEVYRLVRMIEGVST